MTAPGREGYRGRSRVHSAAWAHQGYQAYRTNYTSYPVTRGPHTGRLSHGTMRYLCEEASAAADGILRMPFVPRLQVRSAPLPGKAADRYVAGTFAR
jgi:hypothetical protein